MHRDFRVAQDARAEGLGRLLRRHRLDASLLRAQARVALAHEGNALMEWHGHAPRLFAGGVAGLDRHGAGWTDAHDAAHRRPFVARPARAALERWRCDDAVAVRP